jgi:hypothetical protein
MPVKNAKSKQAALEPILSMPKPRLDVIDIPIISEKPLISNAFPQKVLWQILAGHMQVPESLMPLAAKDPVSNFQACIHWMRGDDGNMYPSMPGSSFKAALVAACRMTNKKLDMTTAKQLFQVIPHRIRIYGDEPRMCEHRVRNDGGGMDIRHRAMFLRWAAILPIRFHAGSISKEVILTLAQLAGFGCGIGDWRIAAPKSNNGQMGAWRLAEDGVDPIGEDFTRFCVEDEPFDWELAKEFGIVPLDRVEYYAKCAAAAAANPLPAKKGRKGSKAPATAEAALAVINGVVPVDGIVAPDGYSPQE